jgi:hypothetical protein
MKQVDATNNAVLRFMKENIGNNNDSRDQDWTNSHDDWSQSTKVRSQHSAPNPQSAEATSKSVTLSGLLNVIDGAAAMEGRLLIMTTNHPEKLDPALTRAGRCDSRFHIGYATKNSSEQTFNRIFGADPCKLHSTTAIERMAQAFKTQFPANSQIPTCDLAKYCGLYRNRPDDAVRDFSKWLKVGDELFSYTIEVSSDAGDIPVNKAEHYDPALLDLSPEDFVVPIALEDEAPITSKPAQSEFDVDDVEYDEWPEVPVLTNFLSFARWKTVLNPPAEATAVASTVAPECNKWPAFDLM